MLLTLTLKTAPARDLGYLLRKHPDRVQTFDLSVGKAHVFYPVATDDESTAALLLDVDPVSIVRGKPSSTEGGLVEAYVNDRPYAVSSFMSVAISKVLGAALGGRADRPDMAEREMNFEVTMIPVRSGGDDLAKRIFAPLGYDVACEPVVGGGTDPPGSYARLTISAVTTLQRLLNHIYVLIPVLDGDKHYWVGDEEVEKLFRFGKDWLQDHPEREFITRRYLRRAPGLARAAIVRLAELDDSVAPDALRAVSASDREEALERPLRLQDRRIAAVASALHELGAKSVIDAGCGEGELVAALVRDSQIDRIVGIDVSAREIERAKARLERVPMPISRRERISLFQSSVLYADRRLHGADAMTLLEVVEHIDLDRLGAMERVVFGDARPRSVIVTTPNREYNALFAALRPGAKRHPDHRFEWSRTEFQSWAEGVARRHGYAVAFHGIGDSDETRGTPTQMAVFACA